MKKMVIDCSKLIGHPERETLVEVPDPTPEPTPEPDNGGG
jgi:hypothetical protein